MPIQGKVDPTDRNFSAALRREIAEETGFTRVLRLSPLRWVVRFRGPTGGHWRLHAFAVELSARRNPRLNEEHEAFAWLDPATAVSRLHYRDNRGALRRLLRTMKRQRRPRSSSRVLGPRADVERAHPETFSAGRGHPFPH